MIETYGIEKFFAMARTPDDTRFVDVYGKERETLKQEWIALVRASDTIPYIHENIDELIKYFDSM